MSRLTTKIKKSIQDEYSLGTMNVYNQLSSDGAVLNKLGKLEDILEEFGIESAEGLRERLSKAIVPKFKSEDVAYRIHHFTHKIEEVMISNTNIQVLCGSPRIFYTIAVSCCDKPITEIDPKSILQEIDGYISQEDEENLYSTRAEAEQKLKELEGK